MNWKEQLHDIHSNIRVMLHSIIGFPRKDETTGSMTERLLPEIEDFISAEIIEKLIADIPDREIWMYTDDIKNRAKFKQTLRDKWLLR